jgi:hypothetical protein
MSGPTSQSQAPLKRRPVASLMGAPFALPCTDRMSSTTIGHVRCPARPYPLRAWAPTQSPISSPLHSHLRYNALTAFSLLCLLLFAFVPSIEHHRWEPLLAPRAPPCHHRLVVRSPSRPPLRANRTPPLMSFPSDQATLPAAKDFHDVSLRWSSSSRISAVLSTARMPDSFPTQPPAPNNRRPPPPHHFRLVDHTPPWRASF